MQTAPTSPVDLAEGREALIALGLGFWRAQALLAAVKLGLFTRLATGPHTASELIAEVGLAGRGARDFLDALVALGLLERRDGYYSNTPLAARYLDSNASSYLGGLFELAHDRLYPVWGKLSVALQSGLPQNEAQQQSDYYGDLCNDPGRLRTFLNGMTGLSIGAADAIASAFPWGEHRSFVDVGGAQGQLSVCLATRHPHLSGISFDLSAVEPYFTEHVRSLGLEQRLKFCPGDFFVDPLPSADVLILGHVLHNWAINEKLLLLQKCYDALPRGGTLIVYESLIDDGRRSHTFGLLMSLNMLLVTRNGAGCTAQECQAWMRQVGFGQTRTVGLAGSSSMVVALK